MVTDEDIRISPVQRAYLRAFDRWLKETWAVQISPVDDEATALKDACFDEMMKDGRILVCTRCGKEPVPQHKAQGRPRKYCLTCAPRQRRRRGAHPVARHILT